MHHPSSIALSLFSQDGPFSIPASLSAPTVLYFMRAQVCPQCNRHARDINRLLPEITARGMNAVVIVPEGIAEAKLVKDRNKLTLPVLAGNGEAHGAAGLEKKLLGLLQQSATIVVDQTGTILYEHIATNPENSFNEKEFLAYLETTAKN